MFFKSLKKILTVFCLSALVIHCHKKEKTELIVGIAPNNPPYEFIDPEKGIMGLEIDILNLVAAFMGKNITFKTLPVDAILPDLTHKEIDIAASGMEKDYHQGHLLFSHTFYAEPFYLITKQKVTTVDELVNQRLGVIENNLSKKLSMILDRNLNTSFTFFNSTNKLLEALNNNSINSILLIHHDLVKIKALLNDHNIYPFDHPYDPKNIAIQNHMLKSEIRGFNESRGFAFAIHKDNRDLLEKINSALQTLDEHRALESLLYKWKLIA